MFLAFIIEIRNISEERFAVTEGWKFIWFQFEVNLILDH